MMGNGTLATGSGSKLVKTSPTGRPKARAGEAGSRSRVVCDLMERAGAALDVAVELPNAQPHEERSECERDQEGEDALHVGRGWGRRAAADIAAWYPKAKPGALFAGDDFGDEALVPLMLDRVNASRLGVAAVEALLNGKSDVMVGIVSGQLTQTHLPMAILNKASLDEDLLRVARILSI